MGGAAIRIEGLTKDYAVGIRGKKLRAVEDLTLTVGEGEIFGLLGPNGGGKSTTIKVLLGLLAPSAGRCLLFDRPIGGTAARARVGFLPEAPYFHHFLSGRELVGYYGRLCGVSRERLAERVEAVIDLVGLSEAADRRIGTYSKGMLQRIGLAQAIVHDPSLVILDEPTAGVDPMGASAIAEIVRELRRRGKTILLSSHLLAQVEGLCDRVAILHRGRLVREGRVEELIEENDAEAYVVAGLDAAGRTALERTIADHGGRLKRVESPRRSLEALFLEAVAGGGGAAAESEEGAS